MDSIMEHRAFMCGVSLELPDFCQVIVTDQRLTCSSPVESRYYNIKSFDIVLVCHKCGESLDDNSVIKFNKLKQQYRTVLPACHGRCSKAPQDGWTMKGVTKKTVKALKRKTPNVDLRTFCPRPIEHSFDGWLADSKQVWNQIIFDNRIKRQIKKRRTRL